MASAYDDQDAGDGMTDPNLAVAVLGAGNVGCALAADLVLRGMDVRLFSRSSERLAPIREAGGITLTGVLEGFAPISVTEALEDAVSGADIVALTVPTPALPWYAPRLATAVTDDQLIWLNPGHSGGALYVAAEIARGSGRDGLRICQMTTASHTSRMTAPAAVAVFVLNHVSLAAFPSRHLEECHERLHPLLPGRLERLPSVLEADLLNVNAVLHPAGMVCNAGWIDATRGDFLFYDQGVGPAIARVIDAVEGERMALAERLGVPTVPILQVLHGAGYTTAEAAATGSMHAAMRASEALRRIRSPASLDHRYLHEDVGCGLVPWIGLAEAAGLSTPTMAALTVLAGLLAGVDYRREGLTLDRMGLTGMTVDEIRSYVAGGRR
jgi:opine dehydrogenase